MGRPAEEDSFSGATLAQEEDNTLARRGLDLRGTNHEGDDRSSSDVFSRILRTSAPHLEDTPRMSPSIRIIGLISAPTRRTCSTGGAPAGAATYRHPERRAE